MFVPSHRVPTRPLSAPLAAPSRAASLGRFLPVCIAALCILLPAGCSTPDQDATPPNFREDFEHGRAENPWPPTTDPSVRMTVLFVQNAVDTFEFENGRYPRNLREMESELVDFRLPKLPSGYRYRYEPNSGRVSVNREK